MSHDWSWSAHESGAPISLMEKCNDEHLYKWVIMCSRVHGMRLFPGNDKSHFVQSHEKGSFLMRMHFVDVQWEKKRYTVQKGMRM